MNSSTRVNVAVLGGIFGFSGMSHGLFEALQGNTATGSLLISAIGEAQRMWVHGNEPAFTILPNYLVTGIAAMSVGFVIIVWTLWFVHRKHGSTILLLLFILLLLVGGGVAQILFFPWIYLVSTKINSPLVFWERVFNRKPSNSGKLWPWFLGLSATLLLSALLIATTGFLPGVTDPEVVITFMLAFLGAEVILLPLTFLLGFARDVQSSSR